MKTLALATLTALVALGSVSPALAKSSQAQPSEREIYVMPIGYGGKPNALAFVKVEGQAARDLYESIASIAAGQPGTAKQESYTNGENFSSTLTTADGTAECTELTGVNSPSSSYDCRLWIQPLPAHRK